MLTGVGGSSQNPITLVSHAPKKSAVPLGFAMMMYQKLMWYVNQYRENAAANSPAGKANGDYTLVVAQVEVDEPLGEDPVGIRYLVFSSSGIKKDLEQQLEDLGVAVVKSEQKGVHAEQVAAAYRENEALQEDELGGEITKVRSAYVTTRVCGPNCAKALGRFIGLGEEESEALENTNGMLLGKVVDKGYLNAARKALGLKPGRGAAMRVVTQSLESIVTPQALIEEGAEEGEK